MRQRILFVLVVIIIDISKSQKLSDNENRVRATNCGKVALPIPKTNGPINITDKAWIVRVYNDKPFKTKLYDSLGSFISPRHVITSAQPIIDSEQKWGTNGTKLDTSNCTNNPPYLMVPDGYVKSLGVRSEKCGEKTNCKEKEHKVSKAWFLNICDPDQFDRKYVMMIVEVKRTTIDYACLADNSVINSNGDTCYAYGIKYENTVHSKSRLDCRLTKIDQKKLGYITVRKYYNPGDRGGPLVVNFNGKATIIGIGATPGFDDHGTRTYFFDVHSYQKVICSTFGICEVQMTTTVLTTSAATSSSVTLTTSGSSLTSKPSDNSTIPTLFTPNDALKVTKAPRKKKPKTTVNWELENDEDDEEEEADELEKYDDDDYDDEEEEAVNGTIGRWMWLGLVGILMLRWWWRDE